MSKLWILYLLPSTLLFFTGNFQLFYLIITIIIPISINFKILKQDNLKFNQATSLLLIIFGIITISKSISAFIGADLGMGILQINNDLTLLLWTALIYSHISEHKKQIDQLSNMIIVLSIGLSILSLILLLPSIPKPNSALNFIYATYGHNHLSSFTILAFPILLTKILSSKTSKLTFWIAGFLTTTFLLTFSRSAFIALAAILVYSLFFFKRQLPTYIRNLIMSATVILITCVVSVWTLTATSYGSHLFKFNPSDNWLHRQVIKPFEFEGRLKYWDQAITAFRQHPLIGYGPNTFPLIHLKYRDDTTDTTNYAQNIFLGIASETGLLGFIPFLAIVSFITWLIIKNSSDPTKTNFIITASIIAMFTQAQLDTNLDFYPLQFFFWGYIGVLLALNRHKIKNIKFSNQIPHVIIYTAIIITTFISTLKAVGIIKSFQAAASLTPLKAQEQVTNYIPFEENVWISLFQLAQSQQIPEAALKRYSIFHKDNPMTTYYLAQYQLPHNLENYQKSMDKVILLNPARSNLYLAEKINVEINQQAYQDAVLNIERLAQFYLKNIIREQSATFPHIDTLDSNISIPITSETANILDAVDYYRLGKKDYAYLSDLLIKLSSQTEDPIKSHLIELSSLISFKTNTYHQAYLEYLAQTQNTQAIESHVDFCRQFKDPQIFCQQFLDDYHITLIKEKLQTAITENQPQIFIDQLQQLIDSYLHEPSPQIKITIPENSSLIPRMMNTTRLYVDDLTTRPFSTSVLMYELGLVAFNDHNLELTTSFFEAAAAITPNWDMFHKELLNMYGLQGSLQKIYDHYLICKQIPETKNGCNEIITNINMNIMEHPGFQESFILEKL